MKPRASDWSFCRRASAGESREVSSRTAHTFTYLDAPFVCIVNSFYCTVYMSLCRSAAFVRTSDATSHITTCIANGSHQIAALQRNFRIARVVYFAGKVNSWPERTFPTTAATCS